MKLFLDPKKPISTCTSQSCEDCPVGGKLICHFSGRQLLKFLLSFIPVFALGVAGLILYKAWLIAVWLLVFVSFFGFVEIRVMCSHCPHYAEPGIKTLKCWANYGAPKLWRYRPGSMSALEKTVFFAGLFIVFVFPIPFLVLSGFYILLGAYALSAVFFFCMLKIFNCRHCINFACPLNGVDKETRSLFSQKQAYNKTHQHSESMKG